MPKFNPNEAAKKRLMDDPTKKRIKGDFADYNGKTKEWKNSKGVTIGYSENEDTLITKNRMSKEDKFKRYKAMNQKATGTSKEDKLKGFK